MALILSGDTGPSIVSASALPAGSVVQVVFATYNTVLTTASTSYIDLGLSASITPFSSNSKILISVVIQSNNTASENGHGTRIVRNSTNVFTSGATTDTFQNSTYSRARSPYFYLDSPETTLAITYKIQVANFGATSMTYQADNCQSQLVLMEISA